VLDARVEFWVGCRDFKEYEPVVQEQNNMMSLISRVALIRVLTLSATLAQPTFHLSPKAAHAQDAPKPRLGKIDAKARRLVDKMIAVYASMKSYSGTAEVEVQLDPLLKPNDTTYVEAQVFVQKPDRAAVRYKIGTSKSGVAADSAVAVYDGSYLFFKSPLHKAEYIKRNIQDEVKRLHAEHRPYHEVGITETLRRAAMVGRGLNVLLVKPELEFMFKDPDLGPHVSLSLGQPGVVEGVPVNTVIWEIDARHLFKMTATYFIGKEDHLLHRMIWVETIQGTTNKMTQTHTNMKINAKLPASTFTFTPPSGAKPVQDFGLAK
jgi:outer membrane lipoprotein-sorting protein